MKSFRDIRVIPVVLVAIFGLAVLKVAGLVLDGGYVFDYQPSQPAKQSWAQENFDFPGGRKLAVEATRHHRLGQEKGGRARKPAAPVAKPAEARRRRRCFPIRTRSRCRRRSAPFSNGCRRGARNWNSARVKSKFARAC